MEEKAWKFKKLNNIIVVNQVIGQGNYCQVKRGFSLEDENQLVAVKIFPTQSKSSSDCILQFMMRQKAMNLLIDSEFIIRIVQILRTPNNFYLIEEYCHEENLQSYLRQKDDRRLSEFEALSFFRHIVEGFKLLFKNNIIHKKLDPSNIMLSQGVAKIQNSKLSIEVNDYQQLKFSPYQSPQIIEETLFNHKCDVWSLGIVFFEMLYGTTPWIGKSQFSIYHKIKTIPLKFPEYPLRSNEVKQLLSGMLKVKEDERMSWEDVFNHPLAKESPQYLNEDPHLHFQNDLHQSIQLNQQYVNNNLVAGYLKTVQEIQKDNLQKQSKLTMLPKQKSEAIEEKLDSQSTGEIFTKIIKNLQIRKDILNINKQVLYERNIAFFFNFSLLKVIQAYDKRVLRVPADLYFRILFSICKYQNIQIDKINAFLNQNKSEQFEDDHWIPFKESNEFSQTFSLILKDMTCSRQIFEELFKKAKVLITDAVDVETNKEKKQTLNTFLSIVDHTFILDSKFKYIFNSTLNEIIKILLPFVFVQAPEKEIVLIVHYLYFCVELQLQFNSTSFDFLKFYEESENSDEKRLLEIVLEKLDYT